MIAFLIRLTIPKHKAGKPEQSSALLEPPSIHGLEPIRWFEKLDRHRDEEVIEQEINGKFKNRFVRSPVDGENVVGTSSETPYYTAKAEKDEDAIDEP